ncbi:MAG: TetR family transcriptional regulator [Alphaproteobacteria bacterium]|nr:TetR family transcriptional regulator [Alphaproteobacteria bacterium]
MARRTKDDAEKTRHAIIDAAEDVFYKRGVSRTSLEEIAKAAGVTRGAVYWHFKDKADLCEAMTRRIMLPYEDMMEKLAAQPSAAPIEDLKNACIHSLRMMAKDQRRRKVVTIFFLRCEYVEEMMNLIQRQTESWNRMLYLAEKLFCKAKELKMLAPQWTPRQAAITAHALMSGFILGGLQKRKSFSFISTGIPCVEAFFNSLQVSSFPNGS